MITLVKIQVAGIRYWLISFEWLLLWIFNEEVWTFIIRFIWIDIYWLLIDITPEERWNLIFLEFLWRIVILRVDVLTTCQGRWVELGLVLIYLVWMLWIYFVEQSCWTLDFNWVSFLIFFFSQQGSRALEVWCQSFVPASIFTTMHVKGVRRCLIVCVNCQCIKLLNDVES